MTGAPAALYVDFDNVFSGLLEQDEGAALRFAEHPEAWLPRLTEELGGPRWLHLRCYVNAGGSARHPRPDEPRIPFLPFRRHFARAGFEVVDCPPLTPQLKNAADIRLAVDAMDALHGPARVEEFVVASSDSDFTPLLTRLRAADRRTTLVTTFEPAEALTAAAGRHLDRDALLALVIGHRASPAPSDGRSLPPGWTAFELAVREEVARADVPLVLSELGKRLRRRLAGQMNGAGWYGHRTLSQALGALEIDGLRLSQHHVWDSTRHHRQPVR